MRTKEQKEKQRIAAKTYRDKHKDRINARRRELRKQNPEKYRKADNKHYRKNRLAHKVNRYGITTEDYKLLLAKQSGNCAICKKEMGVVNIDHCHETQKVRGLLCTSCNTGIGKLKDDIAILQNAVQYLGDYYE